MRIYVVICVCVLSACVVHADTQQDIMSNLTVPGPLTISPIGVMSMQMEQSILRMGKRLMSPIWARLSSAVFNRSLRRGLMPITLWRVSSPKVGCIIITRLTALMPYMICCTIIATLNMVICRGCR